MRQLASVSSAIAPVRRAVVNSLVAFLGWLWGEEPGAYHPEAHYMRGPGPAWRAKHLQGEILDRAQSASFNRL
jgi:hypothetical protein